MMTSDALGKLIRTCLDGGRTLRHEGKFVDPAPAEVLIRPALERKRFVMDLSGSQNANEFTERRRASDVKHRSHGHWGATLSPHDEESMKPSAFVVMERWSSWPADLHRSAVGCVALRQDESELRADLLLRTRNRIRGMERTGHPPGLAVLSCNEDATDAAFNERLLLGRALLGAVLQADKGCLLLLGRRTRAPCGDLFALAGLLSEGLVGSSAFVQVSLDDTRRLGPLDHTRQMNHEDAASSRHVAHADDSAAGGRAPHSPSI
ncbi:MAG TPA: hypothetical protein VK841_03070 [Polyangiaceae bacterium]|jgi:hypothetical protein|nr:hypothetical protein [Polyangiaceae bacterium]